MSKVLEAIMKLQFTLDMEYMRAGIKVHLEPDAFFKLSAEIHQKNQMAAITPEQHASTEIKIAGPSGYITVVKDKTLGTSGYVQVFSQVKEYK